MKILQGTVVSGMGKAVHNLGGVLALLRERTGAALIAGSLNVRLSSPYQLCPDARLAREEYWNADALLLQRCRLGGLRCWIARPAAHEAGAWHGPQLLEVMGDRHLRLALGLFDRDPVKVEVEGDDAWWNAPEAPTASPD